MDDEAKDRELGEAYWKEVVEPVLKPMTVEAYVRGAKATRKSFFEWLQTVPGIQVQATEGLESSVDAVEGNTGRSASAPVPAQKRPLRGAGLAAYEAVRKAGSLTSKELLGELRKLDGGRISEERDNTLLAAIRRLRNAGRLSYDGTSYTLPQDESMSPTARMAKVPGG